MVNQVYLLPLAAFFLFVGFAHAAGCSSDSCESKWGSAASDYVMPFEGAKAYSGSDPNDMLMKMWGQERESLDESHLAYQVYETLHPQIQFLFSSAFSDNANDPSFNSEEAAISSQPYQKIMIQLRSIEDNLFAERLGALIFDTLPGSVKDKISVETDLK